MRYMKRSNVLDNVALGAEFPINLLLTRCLGFTVDSLQRYGLAITSTLPSTCLYYSLASGERLLFAVTFFQNGSAQLSQRGLQMHKIQGKTKIPSCCIRQRRRICIGASQ